MNLKIGTTIKTLRKQHKVSQKELAAALGVTSQAISKWEREICYPDLEHLPILANFFGTTTDRLLNGTTE